MGMYDYVQVGAPCFDIEPDNQWQTKHRRQPMMDTFRIDESGLWLEEVDRYTVPEEERPQYNEEIGGFENPMHKMLGSLGRERVGWDHWDDFHGMFEFHGNVDGDFRRFHAKFTDGELEGIEEIEG